MLNRAFGSADKFNKVGRFIDFNMSDQHVRSDNSLKSRKKFFRDIFRIAALQQAGRTWFSGKVTISRQAAVNGECGQTRKSHYSALESRIFVSLFREFVRKQEQALLRH